MRRHKRTVCAWILCILMLSCAPWTSGPSRADASETVWSDMFWFGWYTRVLGDQGDGIFRTQIWFYRVDEPEGGISARNRIQKQGDLFLDLDLMVAEQYDITYADDLFSLELVDPDTQARLPIRDLTRPLYELYDQALETDMLFEGIPNDTPETLEAYMAKLAKRLNRDPEDPAFQEKAIVWYALTQGPTTARETLTGFVVEMVSALRLPEIVPAEASPTPEPKATVRPSFAPKTSAMPTADAPSRCRAKARLPHCKPGRRAQAGVRKQTHAHRRAALQRNQAFELASIRAIRRRRRLGSCPDRVRHAERFPENRVECTDEALRTLESLGVEAIRVVLESPEGVRPFQRWEERYTLDQLKAGQ